jgi:TonB family protein
MKYPTLTLCVTIAALLVVIGCATRPSQVPDLDMDVKAVPAPSALNVPVPNEPFPVGSESDPLEPPHVLYLDVPNYPVVARETKLEGNVLVELVIGRAGTVDSARVVESSNTVFNRAALAAAYRCRFEPGRIGGQPLEFRWMIPFEFTLTPTPEGPSGGGDRNEWKKFEPTPTTGTGKPLTPR